MAQIVAKWGGRCSACGGRFEAGDLFEYQGKGQTYHTACAPAGSVYTAAGPVAVGPAPPAAPAPLRATGQNADELMAAALAVFEEAMLARALQDGTLSAELSKAWQTYDKLKARAIAGGTEAEARTALRMALRRVIDLVVT